MIFVTGGTGFIGSYIIKQLIDEGHQVKALRRQKRLPFYIPGEVWEKVQWVDGDVLDIVALTDAMQNVDAVVHSAAMVSFHAADRKQMYKVNIEGTANVVNAAIESGVSRFLQVSSVAALGRTATGDRVNEDKMWVDSKINTHYAITKHHAEMEAWRGFAEGLNGAIINPSTVLGYGNWHQSSLAIFRNIYNGFNWYSKGVNGFVGVEDVALAAVRLLESSINHERFIINADNWSFEKLFQEIARKFDRQPPQRLATKTLGAIAWRTEKLKSLLTGKKPLLTRETAMLAHTETYFDHQKLLDALPDFSFTPLAEVVSTACQQYKQAIQEGLLKP